MDFPKEPKYISTIQNVREISLLGTADIAYWRDYLASENLSPRARNGQAEMQLNAVELQWMGIKFREFVVTVVVNDGNGNDKTDGYFLVGAYNTSRLLALSESVLFGTPYTHGEINLTLQEGLWEICAKRGEGEFRARMKGPVASLSTENERFDGKIYIPGKKYFHVRIGGPVEKYPFAEDRNRLAIETGKSNPELISLIDANFVGREWQIRRSGVHARTQTYRRKLAAQLHM